jgi:protein-tyrosine phosphatase
MRHIVDSMGLSSEFEIDSAGTAGWHIGKRPDSRMIAAAEKRGIKMKGSARQVNPDDFTDYDWIFAMDRSNYDDLLDVRDRCPDPTARLILFCEFCEEHEEDEVPDPYYGGPKGFEKVLDLIEDGCTSFLMLWKNKDLP